MRMQRFCQACENNREPIFAKLKEYFANSKHVLEIGSGTGQHAVFFAPALPHVHWHTSDLSENHASILAWQAAFPATNLKSPFVFCVGQDTWPALPIDAVFSANTAHIMQPQETRQMMQLVATNLPNNGVFCLYGPFNINGNYTSEGNRAFDQHLQKQGCGGIRDIAELQSWASGLHLTNQEQMPANNLLLVFKRQ